MISAKRIPLDLQAQRKAQTELSILGQLRSEANEPWDSGRSKNSTTAMKLATGRVETAFIFGSFSLGYGPMRAGRHSQGFRCAHFSHENSVPRRTVRLR